MRSLCVWILLIKEALSSISITVEPSVVLIGNSDIDIRCIVDATNLKSILSIELNRSNETVVGITRKGVAWKDAALKNKTGITINDSTSIVPSYLHLMISKTAVRNPEDFGSYQCSLSAINSHGGLINDFSKTVNLTGHHTTTIDSLDFRPSFATEQRITEVTFKSKITDESFEKNTSKNTSNDNTRKILHMYRAVMIPVGFLISCVFAFVIIREIRLYYFVSNGTDESVD